MTYVMSDLHGYPIEKLEKILNEIGFCDDDRLYILGDVIDRGKDGIKILKWIMGNKRNVALIMGNHEAMMLENRFLFDGDRIPAVVEIRDRSAREAYLNWICNSGDVTVEAMTGCHNAEIKKIFEYLEDIPYYAETEVNGKKFVLTHSGLGNFKKDRPLSDYSNDELIWYRPRKSEKYYDDGRTVIFGHTPTFALDFSRKGKIIRTESWIDIDVGAGKGLDPAVLRLDDMKEFYFDFSK